MSDKIKVIALFGPTASGKTKLAIELAKHYGGEIISADSMQVYKKMEIGTAKPTKDEMENIPHHLIDFLEPSESFNVANYTKLASEKIFDIHSHGKMPIVAGGTGLYIRSLLENIEFTDNDVDLSLRESLQKKAEELGAQAIYDELKEIDPQYASTFHPNNVKRTLRALELYYSSGITMTKQYEISKRNETPFEPCKLALAYKDREVLYNRINLRVDLMLQAGLLSEAKDVINGEFKNTAVQAIGYKELMPYFEGNISLEEAIENIKMESRRYAKRQLTWIRREENIEYLYADELGSFEAVFEKAKEIIDEFLK